MDRLVTPSTPEGMTSLAASLPSIATSRDFSHFAQEACSPAELFDAPRDLLGRAVPSARCE